MWKKIILFVGLLSLNDATRIEEFTGEWTPVAMTPILKPACIRLSITLNPVQCVCADGMKTELLENRRIVDGKIVQNEVMKSPVYILEDVDEINNSLNVSCTCGDEVFPYRMIARPLTDNYVMMYKAQLLSGFNETNIATIYAKDVPKFVELIEFRKTVDPDDHRSGGILCTKEYMDAMESSKNAKLSS